MIAAHHDWDIDVFDFHSVFLNGQLDDDEVIFMELPPGYNKRGHNLVGHLHVALYGSKQGALKWYQQLCSELQDLGFQRAESDWGIFVACISTDLLVLASHVDDCTVTGSSLLLVKAFKAETGSRFRITDLGPISWLLGMHVTRDRSSRTISISQEPYIEVILTKYNFADDKPVSTPMDPHVTLMHRQIPQIAAEITWMCQVPYHAALGSLMYLATGSRPDISFATSLLAQFMENPG